MHAADDEPVLTGAERMAALLVWDGTKTCGAHCACHGDHVCLRAPHPHEPADAQPHIGTDADGELVQWIHTIDDGPMLTAEDVERQVVEARRERTRALLADLDHSMLREALSEPNTDEAEHGSA